MWKISLGYEGPTDSCLILHHPTGSWKEYYIESVAWKILSGFFVSGAKEGVIIDWLAQIIWDDMNNDARAAGQE